VFVIEKGKKLSLLRAVASARPRPQGPKVFWLLFFKKVTAFFTF
jgi:hypothetical protein